MAWFRAIGNAVSVPIVAAVADALLAALEGSVGFGPGPRGRRGGAGRGGWSAALGGMLHFGLSEDLFF